MTFEEHCKQNNIQLLRDDIQYIKRMLQRIAPNARKRVMRGYLDEWVLGRDQCENAIQAQNMGRRRANTYLRNCTCAYDKDAAQ